MLTIILFTTFVCSECVTYECKDIKELYHQNECCSSESSWSCTIPRVEDVSWGVDVTYSVPPSELVRMHNTIATRTPFVLGNESMLSPGIGRNNGNVVLNRYVGAAHAMCFALEVKDFEDKFDFRVCTSVEVLSLSAVIPMNDNVKVLTFATADGDDYETGDVNYGIQIDGEPSPLPSPTPHESMRTPTLPLHLRSRCSLF